jgi:thiol-disulfide isomerase/thioredoxin
MPETSETSPGKLPRRPMLIFGGVAAALVIAVAVWLSNAGAGASECPAQAAAHDAIDKAAGGELAALTATAGGRGYANLAFQDDTGRPMTLADFAGKPLLVNFWATWCVPCREEMPALNALAARYDTDTFAVVPINLDFGAEGIVKAQNFLDEENLPNLPPLADSSFAAFNELKAKAVAIGLPATLLLDEEGCELAVLQGPAAWDSDDGIKVVDALIAASKG